MPPADNASLKGLYVITDEALMPEDRFEDRAAQALAGGASIIQYRDKSSEHAKRERQAAQLRALCEQYGALLIINDDVGLAARVGAHGVHLGVGDASLQSAREALGEDAIIGVSCYANLERAKIFAQMRADYVAFGAFFASPTKPGAAVASIDLLRRARAELEVPVCAIGGIDAGNAADLIEAGADMVAVISGVFSGNDTQTKAEKLSVLFGRDDARASADQIPA